MCSHSTNQHLHCAQHFRCCLCKPILHASRAQTLLLSGVTLQHGESDSDMCLPRQALLLLLVTVLEGPKLCIYYIIQTLCGLFWLRPTAWLIEMSAVKRFITINHIQNKSFCLHSMCLYCIYLLCKYKFTHIAYIYIYWKYVHAFTFIYL